MSDVEKPQLAAKVILLRPTEGSAFEVFLTRAGDLSSSFDFPGGKVIKDDCSNRTLKRCRGPAPGIARSIVGARFTPQEASGPWIAGIRTLFLAVGVLLAVNDADGDAIVDPVRRVRLLRRRDCLRARSLTFGSLLTEERLWADASKLLYFSSWQAESTPGIRFDAHYYLSALLPAQKPFPVFPALGRWFRPEQGVRSCEQGELRMSFATFASLRELADFDSIQRVFQEYGNIRSD